jgi:uncharacterized protein (DUF2062 family)/SAM-dependent methyltransferase
MSRVGSRLLGTAGLVRLRSLLSERLSPFQAAAAVALGLAVGIIPVYGIQAIAAVTLASALRLNRALALAATFINNPMLQPFLVLGAVELGHLVLHGHWMALSPAGFAAGDLKDHLAAFILGSLLLAAVLAPAGGAATYVALSWRARRQAGPTHSALAPGSPVTPATLTVLRRRFREAVARRYASAPLRDRSFVWWKVRLDRIFDTLLQEDLGDGPAVDLGCGYGLALLAGHLQTPGRVLRGYDLDARRIAVARQALDGSDCRLSVADIATVEMEPARLVLIVDVLQYLDGDGQRALLARCVEALEPGGRLLFRVPETRRGGRTLLTRWLDLLLFRVTATGLSPTHLPATGYRQWLETLGLTVRESHVDNRLPLSHVVFVATKPERRPDA